MNEFNEFLKLVFYQSFNSKLYFRIMCLLYLLFLLPHTIWRWHGIWSIYTTQVNDNTYIGCRYCPPLKGDIIELNKPNTPLKEVHELDLANEKMEVLNYPYNFKSSQTIFRQKVKGIILFQNHSLESSTNFYALIGGLLMWILMCLGFSKEQVFWWRIIMTFSASVLLIWLLGPAIV